MNPRNLIITVVALLVVLVVALMAVFGILRDNPSPTPVAVEHPTPTVSLTATPVLPEVEIIVETPNPTPLPQPVAKDVAERLWQDLETRIAEYTTVRASLRYEFPYILEDILLGTTIRFSGQRPDRFVYELLQTQPEKRGDPETAWNMEPLLSELWIGDKYQMVSHGKRNVHNFDLKSPTPEVQAMLDDVVRANEEKFSDVLQDFWSPVDHRDWSQEFLRGELRETEGKQEYVFFYRITGQLINRLETGRTAKLLPTRTDVLKVLALKREYFDPETGLPTKFVYYDREQRVMLIHYIDELSFDEPIPESHFSLRLPREAKHKDFNEVFERAARQAEYQQDYQEIQERIRKNAQQQEPSTD